MVNMVAEYRVHLGANSCKHTAEPIWIQHGVSSGIVRLAVY